MSEDNLSTLNISSNLNLSAINFPKFPKNVTVSEELNDYLRGQLQHMKRENECLEEKLSSTDIQLQESQTKIAELSEKIQKLEFTPNNDFTQLADCKIMELSRKLREKNAEIEVYKSKLTKIERKLSQMENTQKCEDTIKKEAEMGDSNGNEMKKLQEKLVSITNKWSEEKNQNLQLKNDLKKANKWLQQEIGEKFETLVTLNNNNSTTNWRGRAQIIRDLQQKNQELKEKLRAYQDKSTIISDSSPVKCDKKNELLAKENAEIRNNFDEVKRKYDAAKARVRVLETECNMFKMKISTLHGNLEMSETTIARLQAQVASQNALLTDDFKQKDQMLQKLKAENEQLKIELAKEKYLLENKSKELIEKNDDIDLLNKRIRSARPRSSYLHKNENPDQKTISRLEVERLRLLELTELQNTRLEDERNAHLKTQHLLKIEKQKGAKLEANLARLQLEQTSFRSSYSHKSNSSTNISKLNECNLADKLELAEENIKALSTRLQIEIHERKRDLQEFAKVLKK